MSRPLRIQYPGAVYHIMNRGNAYQDLFTNKHDYILFLDTLIEIIEKYNWEVYAYSLMPNHYHLLIKTVEPNLSIGMRDLNGNYTLRFNAKHQRVGHLFQGRYKSIIVDENNYLAESIRYITLNPVRAKLVKDAKDWQWSSHSEMLSRKKRDYIVKRQKVLSFFSKNKQLAKKEYISFIHERIDDDIWSDLKGGLVLGGDSFVEKINDIIDGSKYDSKEYIKKQRNFNRYTLDNIFKNTRNKTERNRQILVAREKGYTLNEIAEHLNLHYTSISMILKKHKNKKPYN